MFYAFSSLFPESSPTFVQILDLDSGRWIVGCIGKFSSVQICVQIWSLDANLDSAIFWWIQIPDFEVVIPAGSICILHHPTTIFCMTKSSACTPAVLLSGDVEPTILNNSNSFIKLSFEAHKIYERSHIIFSFSINSLKDPGFSFL